MTPPRYGRRNAKSSPQGVAFGRSRWRDLVKALRSVAEPILAGNEPDFFAWAAFRRALNETGRSSLPVHLLGQSATHAQLAFVSAARGLAIAEGERRSSFARLAVPAAQLVDELLDAAGRAEADATWRRQLPPDERD